ncbi:tail length tape measure protein [Escherichia phage vB_EcoM_ECO1230-10]|uniref:Putative phage tail protein n=1 Tax=Escherichia phage vB_EcoM_ECO1230-10 TaxID=669875 RepID=D5LGY4_9CAUD|nr:tail length tape measure protein [Escherichia phage vB_EcoM_ECO1230-10]ADE87915.1 putative phage tail protein [Escherichia phage vB_EcoM_ECO1230-10]
MANKKLNATITIGGAVSSSLKGAFGTVKSSVEQVGAAMAKLEREQRTLTNAIQTFGRQGKNVDSLRAKYAANVAAVDKLRTATERLKRVEDARERNLAKREQYKDGIMGTIALGATIAAPVKAAIDFESTMADVKKVVDFDTPDGFKKMGQDIINMSKVLPMTANDIGKIVAAGGQSGIAAKELMTFAESAIKMGVAFDITADQAGQAMAEMRSAFKMNQQQVVVLADKINYLGNNTAASAKDIMEIVQRIGPLGEVAGTASGEIAALGATLRGMGVQNEIAATGIKNLMLSLTAGKAATKSQREAFARLGYSSTAVAKSMQLDSKKTMLVILKQVAKLRKHEQSAVLTQLFGKEVVGSIAPLLTNIKELEKNFDAVANKMKYAGSMEKEYQARAATTANELVIFRNQITALGITIGSVLLPAFNSVLKTISPWIGKVTELAQAHPVVTKAIVATAGALITMRIATFAAGFAFTYLRGGALRIVGALAGARAQMALTAVSSRAVGAAATVANGGLLGMATRGIPAVVAGVRAIGAAFISTGIGALITGLALGGLWIYRNWAGVKAFMTGTLQGIQQGLQPVTEKFQALWDKLGPVKTAFQWVADVAGKVWDWFTKLAEPVSYSSEELKKAGDAGQKFGKALAAGIDFVLGPIQFLIDKIIWVSDNIGALTQKAIDFKNSVSDMAGSAWESTKDFFRNPFGGDDVPEGNTLASPMTPGNALPAPALANRGGSTYTDSSTTTIQVTQRPGENNADLAKRIADEQERRRQVRQRSMMNDGVTAP